MALIPFNSVGGYSTGLTRTTVITASGGICASGGTFANLNVVSGLTNVSPLTITASSLADGVGILRLTGSEPDINLNDTDGGFNTLTFENAGNARVAIGRNSNNEFYVAVRDPAVSGGAYKDKVIVADSSTGIVNLGYGLCASGGVTFSGTVEFDSLARFDGGLCAGSGVTFSSGLGATGDIFFHGAPIGSTLGTAPKFFARAWVNFNGNTTNNLGATYSQSGTTVSVTAASHGLTLGNLINIDITSGTGVDGIYTVASVANANTFGYTAGTSLTTSGNATLLRNTIRSSGNVSSIADNGVGDYTINFITPMPDANYVVTGNAERSAAVNFVGISISHLTAPTASALRIETDNDAGGANDPIRACVAIFR